MNTDWRRVRLVRAAAAAAAVFFFLTLVLRFWHPVYGFTQFLHVDGPTAAKAIKEFRAQPVYVYPGIGTYDGIWYAQLSYHPLLNSPELASAIDTIGYRARRMLLPALAWILAAGQPTWIVHVYSVINALAWLAMAGLLWRILSVGDSRSYAAWLGVLFSAGALESVRLALTDLGAATLLAAAMLAAEAGRGAAGWLGAAALARETSLISLPAICTRPWLSWPNLRRTLVAVLPLAIWLSYMRSRVGAGDNGWANFTVPFAGYAEKWRDSFAALWSEPDRLLAAASLLALVGLTVQAAFVIARPRLSEPWWRLGAAYVVLMILLGHQVWNDFPGAAPRVLLPMTLAFNVLARRRSAGWVWVLAGNLTVFSGLVAFRDVPPLTEVAAVRSGGAAALVREGQGWFGPEHNFRHRWAWSSGTARLEFETWPHNRRVLRCRFLLRSPAPQTVVVRQGSKVLWRGLVSKATPTAVFDVQVDEGRAEVEFSSDGPAVREGPGASGRSLAFGVLDPKVWFVNEQSSPP
jgi:hypothetical protein